MNVIRNLTIGIIALVCGTAMLILWSIFGDLAWVMFALLLLGSALFLALCGYMVLAWDKIRGFFSLYSEDDLRLDLESKHSPAELEAMQREIDLAFQCEAEAMSYLFEIEK